MKDYREIAEEALRRRDAHIINRKKNIKKAVILLSSFAFAVLFGYSAWFIGAGRSEKPEIPPVITDAVSTDGVTETDATFPMSESDPEVTFPDSSDAPESEDVTTSSPLPNTEDDTFSDSAESSVVDTPTDDTVTDPLPGNDPTDTDITYPDHDDPISRETDEADDTIKWEDALDTPYQGTSDGDKAPTGNGSTSPSDGIIDNDPCDTQKPTDGTTSVAVPEGEDGPEPDTETRTDAEGETDPAVSLPPMPGRPATPNDKMPTDTETVGPTVKEEETTSVRPEEPGDFPVDSPTTNGDPSFAEKPGLNRPSTDDRVLYYSIDFDVEDCYFIDENTSIPENLPVYIINDKETADAETAIGDYLKFLYGEQGYLDMGSFSNKYTDPVFFTKDRYIVNSSIGRYIATDSEKGTIYYTVALGGSGSGMPYRDMTKDEAFVEIKNTQYYASVLKYLGINDPMVNTEIYRYYADGVYEYRFMVTERAEDVLTAGLNYATASAEFRMIFSPADETLRCEVVINWPKTLRAVGYSNTVPYSDAMDQLLEKYRGDEYYEAYCRGARMTVKYIIEDVSGLTFVSPFYCYYMAYADTDGSDSYYIVDTK